MPHNADLYTSSSTQKTQILCPDLRLCPVMHEVAKSEKQPKNSNIDKDGEA
jgi:hypothetical protein